MEFNQLVIFQSILNAYFNIFIDDGWIVNLFFFCLFVCPETISRLQHNQVTVIAHQTSCAFSPLQFSRRNYPPKSSWGGGKSFQRCFLRISRNICDKIFLFSNMLFFGAWATTCSQVIFTLNHSPGLHRAPKLGGLCFPLSQFTIGTLRSVQFSLIDIVTNFISIEN